MVGDGLLVGGRQIDCGLSGVRRLLQVLRVLLEEIHQAIFSDRFLEFSSPTRMYIVYTLLGCFYLGLSATYIFTYSYKFTIKIKHLS